MIDFEYKQVCRKAKQKEIISNVVGFFVILLAIIFWTWVCLN